MITPRKSASRVYLKALITMLAKLVMDEETGQLITYCQLHTHPKFAHICNQSYSNEMVCLRQGVKTGVDVTGKRVDGTNNFYVIQYEDTPQDHRKEITYKSVVCEVIPQKEDSKFTSITVGGNHI